MIKLINTILFAFAVSILLASTVWAQSAITPSAPLQDANGYYLIGTAAELYGFAELVNNGNATANGKLTADIVVNEKVLDANGEANTGNFVQWTPIGNYDNRTTYSGTFDGQGHTVSGLYVSGSGGRVGFIGEVSGSAVVKDLGVVDSYFSSSHNFLGSIVGRVSYNSSVTLANVYSTSTVKGANWIGGLAGGGDGSVSVVNSYFAGKTSAGWSYGSHHDDLVAGDFNRSTLTVCNAFVLGTSQYGTSVTAGQLSDGTVAATLHYYQDALADGSMFGISDGKTAFSGSLEGVSVTTADITLHTFDVDTKAYSSKYIVGNATPLPVNVEREGYTFFGWYDNADLEGDAVTSISSSESGNKEYWAKFERSHSVTFVLNGGNINTGAIDHYIEGETTALPTMVFKNSASFEGWYTTEDFTGSRYYSIPSTATEDMTFYAKWGEAKTTFYLVQGDSPEPVNVLYEGENVVYLDKTTMDGYYVSDEGWDSWGGFSGDVVNVPYTGEESTFGNGGRAFEVAQSGFYVFTLTDKGEGNWFVSVLYPLENYITAIADIPDQTYTGTAIKPEIDITTTLTSGTDYTVTFSNNTNAGIAKATITGIGNYAGTIEKTFIINPRVTTSGALTLTEYGNRTTAEIQGDFTNISSEGKSLEILTPKTVNKVIFKRSYTKGIPATIMLPFNFTLDASIGSFYTIESVTKNDNGEWIATPKVVTGTLQANTPYMFKAAKDLKELSFTDENGITLQSTSTIEINTNGDWTLHGVYEKTMLDGDGEFNYGFAGQAVTADGISVGDFIRAGEGVWTDPMRCYLTYKKGELTKAATVLPDRIRVVFPDEVEQPDNGEIVTPVSEIATESGVKVWSYDGTVYIEAQPDMDYTIVDLTGRTIKKGITHSTHEEINLNAKGIVIVKIGNKSFKLK